MEQSALLDPVAPPVPPDSAAPGGEMYGRWLFDVPGIAAPQGSWVSFISKTTGRAMGKPSNERELTAWRKTVADHARHCRPPWLAEPWDGPVFLSLLFVRERGDDYRVDGTTLKKGARRYPDTAPDGDKLDRAVWDALTGVAFTNDARVVSWVGAKRYAAPGEAAHVEVEVGFLRP